MNNRIIVVTITLIFALLPTYGNTFNGQLVCNLTNPDQSTHSLRHLASTFSNSCQTLAKVAQKHQYSISKQIDAYQHVRQRLQEAHLEQDFHATYQKLESQITQCTQSLKLAQVIDLKSVTRHVEPLLHLITFKCESPTLQKLYDAAIDQLKKVVVDANGYIKKELSSKDVQSIHTIIENFNRRAVQWHQSLEGQIDHANDLVTAKNYGFSNQITSTRMLDQFFGTEIYYLLKIEKLGSTKDLAAAHDIVQQQSRRFYNPEHNYFRKAYLKHFYEHYNQHGIDKQFLDDPFVQRLGPLALRETINEHNAVLAARHALKHEYLQRFGITRPSAYMLKTIYQMVDLADNPYAMIEQLCGQLSADHPDPIVVEAYTNFFRNGLLKNSRSNSVAQISWPKNLSLSQHAKERVLLNQLALLETSDPLVAARVQAVVLYLQKGLSNDKNAHAYRYLAHEIGSALVHNTHTKLFDVPDFSQQLQNATQEEIKELVVSFIITTNQQSRVGAILEYDAARLIDKVSIEYGNMRAGCAYSQLFLQEALSNTACKPYLEWALDNDLTTLTDVELKTCASVWRDIEQQGYQVAKQQYSLDPTMRLFLVKHGNHPNDYEQFQGHQYEHFVHQLDIKNLQTAAQIELQELNVPVRKMFEFAVQSNLVVNGLLKIQQINTAYSITATAGSIYLHIQRLGTLGQEVIGGIQDGLIQSVVDLYTIVRHPAQTLTGVCKLALKFAEFADLTNRKSIAKIFDEAEYQKLQTQYTEKLAPIKESIQNATPRDWAREITAFIFGPKIIGKCATLAKIGTSNALQRIAKILPRIAKTQEVATAEGGAVKVAQKAEHAALSEMQHAGKQTVITSEKVISPVETSCPASCLIQYEKLKEALKIKEITSVINCTQHGLQRLLERGFETNEIISIFKKPDFIRIQNDGAKAFIQKNGDKFRIIVLNEKTGEVVTALKNTTNKKIIKLGINYGWKL